MGAEDDSPRPGFLPDTELPTRSGAFSSDGAGQEPLPDRIGPFRILDRIGEGGFGIVYLAEQTTPVRRKVALKILKLGMDSKQLLARFETEKQALALMDHPGVARVYDAGITEAGRPYFVMEYVPGVPITLHCDRHRLGVEQRLELLIAVAGAVHHAHQKGIIHRDIKPSNILVTYRDDEAIPKVIDFGVAKALAQPLTDRTLVTEFGQLVGTPEYMSPEQAEMTPQDVDTRSDVYSLGVLLYELLTGSLPFDTKTLRSAGVEGIQRIIREDDPPRPSTRLVHPSEAVTTAAEHRRTDARSLRLELCGDLDWIVMRALEKDRSRRYGSAAGLAEDLRRHLRHEPVVARPPSMTYRMRKFVRRHRLGVAAAGLMLAALVVGLVLATFGFVQASRERNRALEAESVARKEAAKASAISDFLQEMLSSVDPALARGRDVTVREVLDQAARRVEDSFRGQPEVEGALRRTIGSSYAALGKYDDAVEQLESSLELCRSSLGEEHPTTLGVRAALATVNVGLGRYAEAEQELRQVWELQRAVSGENHADTLSTTANLAWSLRRRGKLAEAEPLFRQLVEARTRVSGEGHPETLRSAVNLGNVLMAQGKLTEADALLPPTAKRSVELLGEDHPVTLYAKSILAWLRGVQGRLSEAEELRREVLGTSRRVLGEEHPNTLQMVGYLAWTLMERDQYEEAEFLCREAVEILERKFGRDHPDTLEAMNTLAVLLCDKGECAQCEALYGEVYQTRRRVLGEEHPQTLQSLNNLGTFELEYGTFGEAARLFEKGLEIRTRLVGKEHPETLDLLANLGLAQVYLERFEEAKQAFDEVLELRSRVLGKRHPDTISVRGMLAEMHAAAGESQQAKVLFEQVVEEQSEVQGRTHPATLRTISQLASLWIEEGRYGDAERLLADSMEPALAAKGLSPDRKARFKGLYGDCLAAAGRYEEAEPLLLESHETLAGLWGSDSAPATWTAGLLADLYGAWGKPGKAARWRTRADAAK